MATWSTDELDTIGRADELQIAPRRRDGTRRPPVTIWVVRLGDDLYVRSWRGPSGRWFRGAQQTHHGHIRAGGVERDVTFVDADDTLNDSIDAAYRTKYRRYADSYVPPMLSPDARATTLRLVPDAAPSARTGRSD
jgi:hypothetical protein